MIMTQNINVKVSLTLKVRLEQALKEAGVEDAALVRKLTIDGMFMNNTDFEFIRQYMSDTLQEVELGANIKFGYVCLIGYTFDFCNALNNIIVHQDNPDLAGENGVLFNKKKTKLICYPKGRKGDGEGYVIPNSVVIVGINAFYGCSLTSICIPASVLKIHVDNFMNCTTYITVHSDNPVYESIDGKLKMRENINMEEVAKLGIVLKRKDTG